MLYQLQSEETLLAAPLFQSVNYHLAAQAALQNKIPARIFVDDPRQPHAALIQARHRFFLAGQADNFAFNQALHQLFAEDILPRAKAIRQWGFSIFHVGAHWEPVIEQTLLPGKTIHRPIYQYYACHKDTWSRVPEISREVPEGLTVRLVDRALTEDRSLTNLDDLLEEMQSERESVESFLANSFGICLLSGDQVVTWCLSEYNLGGRCEVGIATAEPYRKRGLATLTGILFVEYAFQNGMEEIGWHCWARNTASGATAKKVGLEKVGEHLSYLVEVG